MQYHKVLVSEPILVVSTPQTYQSTSDEHSRCNGGTGYCIGRVLADSILAATAAAAMVKWSWDWAVGRNRPQIYVGFVPKATYTPKLWRERYPQVAYAHLLRRSRSEKDFEGEGQTALRSQIQI